MGIPTLLHAVIIKVDLNGATIQITYSSDSESIALQGEGDGLSWLPTRGLQPIRIEEHPNGLHAVFHIQLMGQESCEFRARAWDNNGTQYWESIERHHLIYNENKQVLLDGTPLLWGTNNETTESTDSAQDETKKDVVSLLSQKLKEKEKTLAKKIESTFSPSPQQLPSNEDDAPTTQSLTDLIKTWEYTTAPPLTANDEFKIPRLINWILLTLLTDKGSFEFDSEHLKQATVTLHESIPQLTSKTLYDFITRLSPFLYEILYLSFSKNNLGEDQVRETFLSFLPELEKLHASFQEFPVSVIAPKTVEQRKNQIMEFKHYLFKFF